MTEYQRGYADGIADAAILKKKPQTKMLLAGEREAKRQLINKVSSGHAEYWLGYYHAKAFTYGMEPGPGRRPDETLRYRLRFFMDQAGVSVPDLVARSGLSRQHIHQILEGRTARLTWATVCKLSEALGVSADVFKS